jgi:beta-glucosidase
VQVYVSAPQGNVPRPVRELKGFARVTLSPGESKPVTITLNRDAFAYYDTDTSAWKVPAGEYTIEVGASSRDTRLTKRVAVQ